MPEVWCWYEKVYGRSRSSWSAVRVDAGKHVDFCRCFVLSSTERSKVTHFTSDKTTGALLFHRVAMENHGVFLRYSYSSGLILPLLVSDTPVLPSGADALDVLRAKILRRRGRYPSPLYLTHFGKVLGRRKEERSPSQYMRTNVRRLMGVLVGKGNIF